MKGETGNRLMRGLRQGVGSLLLATSALAFLAVGTGIHSPAAAEEDGEGGQGQQGKAESGQGKGGRVRAIRVAVRGKAARMPSPMARVRRPARRHPRVAASPSGRRRGFPPWNWVG